MVELQSCCRSAQHTLASEVVDPLRHLVSIPNDHVSSHVLVATRHDKRIRFVRSGSGGVRTHDLRVKSALLVPTELHSRLTSVQKPCVVLVAYGQSACLKCFQRGEVLNQRIARSLYGVAATVDKDDIETRSIDNTHDRLIGVVHDNHSTNQRPTLLPPIPLRCEKEGATSERSVTHKPHFWKKRNQNIPGSR